MIETQPPSLPQMTDRQRARIEDMLSVARAIFFESGYAGTSMSAVAAAIGGSKTTLWRYFSSKEALFSAVVDDLVARYGALIEDVPLPKGSIRETLTNFGLAVVAVVLNPDVVAAQRLVVGEAGRFPEIGSIFFQKGPGRAEYRLSVFFTREMAAGRIVQLDPTRAAQHFLQMCQANSVNKQMLGLAAHATKSELEADVRDAVDAFLRAYSAEPAARKGLKTGARIHLA